MKKLIGTFALTALASSVFAQGLVQFNNASGVGPVQKWTSTANSTLVSVTKSTGTTTINGRVQVLAFYNSTAASLTPLFTPTSGGVKTTYTTLGAFLSENSGWVSQVTAGMGTLQNGVFNAGVQTVGVNDGLGGTSLDGASVRYAILGWTGNYTSYDLAYAANVATPGSSFMGISPVFTTGSGNPYASPTGAAISISQTFTGMGPLGLAPVIIPEPTSFALAGMGIAALLAFRRRS